MMGGMFTKMTKAFNQFSSTLGTTSAGARLGAAGREARYGMQSGFSSMRSLAGVRSKAGLKDFGRGMASKWKGMTGMQRGGLAGSYGAAGAAGMAAADFLNPWGLGWGD